MIKSQIADNLLLQRVRRTKSGKERVQSSGKPHQIGRNQDDVLMPISHKEPTTNDTFENIDLVGYSFPSKMQTLTVNSDKD